MNQAHAPGSARSLTSDAAVHGTGSAAGSSPERVVEIVVPSLHAHADGPAKTLPATAAATPKADKKAPSTARIRDAAALAALAAALPGGTVVGAATIPTKLRNWNSNNSKRSRYGITQEECEVTRSVMQSCGGFATGRTNDAASEPRPGSLSSKRSKKTTPITALPHYRCARSTYESSAAASVFTSDTTTTTTTPHSSQQRAASLRLLPLAPQPPQIQVRAHYYHQQHPSSVLLWQASSDAPAAASAVAVPAQSPSLAAQRVRHIILQDVPQKDVPFPAPTLEALLLRQKQKQQSSLLDHSQSALESMRGSSSATGQDPRPTPTSDSVAAPPGNVVSLADLAHEGTLLKPRRSSPAALPSDYAPSKVDVVLELLSEPANRSASPSASSLSSDASPSSAAAPANACRRAGSAQAFDALLHRHLLAYIESTRRSRSHIIDHLLALVERSGGRFCRFDKSCHRWIQVGYETSFELCASEFKAGARDVLKRIQLLRNLERQEPKSEVEEHPPAVQVTRSTSTASDVMHTGQEPPSADSQTVHPKPSPDPLPRPTEAAISHQSPTARTHEHTSTHHSDTGSVASDPVPPRPLSSREHTLQTKFKRPKMKAPPFTSGSAAASCERVMAPRPTSPMPRRVTNEQESTTSANS